jgi:16S rRNA (uracil1498-N3)-methyltransferase
MAIGLNPNLKLNMHIFFQDDLTNESNQAVLNEDDSKHASKVLRLNTGDKIGLINGRGALFSAVLGPKAGKKFMLKITDINQDAIPKQNLHLAVAPTKNIDRFEMVLEKATELGITEITPILCQHSERNVIKPERLEKIIIAALKQSKNVWMPKLNPLTQFKLLIKENGSAQKLIAHCEQGQKKHITEIIAKGKDTILLIGPEGDFSSEEIDVALSNNYIPVSLGNTRLRTETAALTGAVVMTSKNWS